MEKLIFFKCYFCSKNFKKLQIIVMNNNSVTIDDDEITYESLIFDTCFFKIDNNKQNYVCEQCNNNLFTFHFFKRDTKKYANFNVHLQKLEILAKAEAFLDGAASFETLKIDQDASEFSISLKPDEPVIIAKPEKQEIETEVIELIEYDSGEDTEFIIETHTTSAVTQWIEDEVKSSNVVEGEGNQFECSVCGIAFGTEKMLSSHLQHMHSNEAIRAEREMKEDPFNDYGKACFVGDAETLLQCTFCDQKRVFKFERTLKIHMRLAHDKQTQVSCQCGASFDDQSSLLNHAQQCDNSSTICVEAIEETFEEEHLQIELPEEPRIRKKRKLNTLNDLDESQINWIREQVAAGEYMKGRKKAFKCQICDCQLSHQASLTRHLRDVHLLKNDTKSRENFKDEVNNSKLAVETQTGVEVIWKCQRCEIDRIYKCEQAFKLHLRMTHIRATKVATALITACKVSIEEDGNSRDAYQCPDCDRIFRQRETLRFHIKSEHPNINEEETKERLQKEKESCKTSAHRIAQILEHKLQVGKSANFCHECGLKFQTSKQRMKSNVHTQCHEVFKTISENQNLPSCEACRMIFGSEDTFRVHELMHENAESIALIPADGLSQHGAVFYKESSGDADSDEEAWKCGHCRVRYFDERDCVTHIMLLHMTSLTCFIDNREFSGAGGLSKFTQHMRNKHPELFPDLTFPCGSCKTEFSTIYEKLAHQKVCSSKKFECDNCGKRFLNKHKIAAHILYEAGLTGFSCEFCGKRCVSQSDLKIHQNIHTQSRPYWCSICTKTFKTPGARSTHMESHSDGISCEICGQKLANRTLYQRHKKFQHDNEFRESQMVKNHCKLCNKSFMRENHYKLHMKQHHGIQLE